MQACNICMHIIFLDYVLALIETTYGNPCEFMKNILQHCEHDE